MEFYGEDCLDRFLTLILQDKKYKKCTFIAHNAGVTTANLSCAGSSATARSPRSFSLLRRCTDHCSLPTIECALLIRGISSQFLC
jgi:hypothetical protein